MSDEEKKKIFLTKEKRFRWKDVLKWISVSSKISVNSDTTVSSKTSVGSKISVGTKTSVGSMALTVAPNRYSGAQVDDDDEKSGTVVLFCRFSKRN